MRTKYLFTYHFLLYNLSDYVRHSFQIKFDNGSHNYLIYRCKGSTIQEFFVVVRTSKKVYRVTHYRANGKDGRFYAYYSAKSYRDLARWINSQVSVE